MNAPAPTVWHPTFAQDNSRSLVSTDFAPNSTYSFDPMSQAVKALVAVGASASLFLGVPLGTTSGGEPFRRVVLDATAADHASDVFIRLLPDLVAKSGDNAIDPVAATSSLPGPVVLAAVDDFVKFFQSRRG